MLKSLLLPALASIAYAESTVTSMYIFGADPQPLVASIVGNDATATTYNLECAPGTDSSDCGMGLGMTLVAAGDTTTYIYNEEDVFHMTAECTVDQSTALCTESAGGSEANFPGVMTTTDEVVFMPVTITAGRITAASTTTTATTSTDGASSTDGTAASSTESTTSGRAESTSTGNEATPTGAAAQVTGAFGAVLGGAVVALAGAAF